MAQGSVSPYSRHSHVVILWNKWKRLPIDAPNAFGVAPTTNHACWNEETDSDVSYIEYDDSPGNSMPASPTKATKSNHDHQTTATQYFTYSSNDVEVTPEQDDFERRYQLAVENVEILDHSTEKRPPSPFKWEKLEELIQTWEPTACPVVEATTPPKTVDEKCGKCEKCDTTGRHTPPCNSSGVPIKKHCEGPHATKRKKKQLLTILRKQHYAPQPSPPSSPTSTRHTKLRIELDSPLVTKCAVKTTPASSRGGAGLTTPHKLQL
eukprot:m.18978 g.18978  ORF g.18978 m.18978 type:complete len:265 (-) comp12290_c0_seq1:431-1225(-)